MITIRLVEQQKKPTFEREFGENEIALNRIAGMCLRREMSSRVVMWLRYTREGEKLSPSPLYAGERAGVRGWITVPRIRPLTLPLPRLRGRGEGFLRELRGLVAQHFQSGVLTRDLGLQILLDGRDSSRSTVRNDSMASDEDFRLTAPRPGQPLESRHNRACRGSANR
jgi:hypothetical protein